MTDSNTLEVGIFGLGEAGSRIASGLVSAGADVVAFDPAPVETPPGVQRVDDPAGAVKGRALVMAITAARDAQGAIAQAWDVLPRGGLYADLSTAPPTLKEDLSDTATLRGLRFADVALMSTVEGSGLATPSLVSGSGAARYRDLLTPFGADVEVVGEEPGWAAAHKLLRSVVTKGLTALVVESLAAARQLDLEAWLSAHILEFAEGLNQEMLERLVSATSTHLERRIVEMGSAAALLESVGVEPLMTTATETLLRRIQDEMVQLPEDGLFEPSEPRKSSKS